MNTYIKILYNAQINKVLVEKYSQVQENNSTKLYSYTSYVAMGICTTNNFLFCMVFISLNPL